VAKAVTAVMTLGRATATRAPATRAPAVNPATAAVEDKAAMEVPAAANLVDMVLPATMTATQAGADNQADIVPLVADKGKLPLAVTTATALVDNLDKADMAVELEEDLEDTVPLVEMTVMPVVVEDLEDMAPLVETTVMPVVVAPAGDPEDMAHLAETTVMPAVVDLAVLVDLAADGANTVARAEEDNRDTVVHPVETTATAAVVQEEDKVDMAKMTAPATRAMAARVVDNNKVMAARVDNKAAAAMANKAVMTAITRREIVLRDGIGCLSRSAERFFHGSFISSTHILASEICKNLSNE